MRGKEPRWDRDLDYGEQGELLVDQLHMQVAQGHASTETKRERRENSRFYCESMQFPKWRGSQARWVDSGIRVSEADYWVIYKPGGLFLYVPLTRLKALIASGKPPPIEYPKGDNPTRGHLVNLADLFDKIEGTE